MTVYVNDYTALLGGGRVQSGNPHPVIVYDFGTSATINANTRWRQAPGASMQNAVRDAMAEIASVTNIDFVEAAPGQGATLHIQTGDDPARPGASWGELPNATGQQSLLINPWLDFMSSAWGGSGSPEAKHTIRHELLHILGLDHPHDATDGVALVPELDNTSVTTLSYNGPGGASTHLTGMDISALQALYGARDEAVNPVVTTQPVNLIRGSNHADGTFGTDSPDRIEGYGGNDSLNGGYGNDTIFGGVGNDLLRGEIGSDVLYGEDGDDILVGGEGRDALWGGMGNDRLEAGDVAIGGGDKLHGEWGNDVLLGGNGNDTLDGGLDQDWIEGGYGADLLVGREGNDTLLGDGGNDTLQGGAGADWLEGRDGNDQVYGGAGVDTLFGAMGADYLQGDDGNDVLYGEWDNDALHGDDGNDVLSGGMGNDTLFGGAGHDVLQGDLGADAFAFAPGEGIDTIVDFRPWEGDRIWLANGLKAQTVYEAADGMGCVVHFAPDNGILIQGIHANQFDQAWLASGFTF